jgi:hypothetical protein
VARREADAGSGGQTTTREFFRPFSLRSPTEVVPSFATCPVTKLALAWLLLLVIIALFKGHARRIEPAALTRRWVLARHHRLQRWSRHRDTG